MSVESTPEQRGGYVFRIFREAHGLGVRQAAGLIGMNAGYLSRIEHGHARPSPAMYWRLIEFYATTEARAS